MTEEEQRMIYTAKEKKEMTLRRVLALLQEGVPTCWFIVSSNVLFSFKLKLNPGVYVSRLF